MVLRGVHHPTSMARMLLRPRLRLSPPLTPFLPLPARLCASPALASHRMLHTADDKRPPSPSFWASASVWRRAATNTLRCLVGCSAGDLSMLYVLQTHAPTLPLPITVAASCTAGILTSLALETVVLRVHEGFEWRTAFRTAAGMSMGSMISMELAENAVELWLTGGLATCEPQMFWAALPPALLAGFLTPLPFNYYMIRKHGRACH
ncbi:hypothetical protein AB1Y20_021981 [Prymnesium parvum]|uniref:DUF4396 domain-containing protein n=1 Tax=Prymnesium parvum TaxID=97485 RepID=A0AB34JEL6_PRYPA